MGTKYLFNWSNAMQGRKKRYFHQQTFSEKNPKKRKLKWKIKEVK